VVTKKTSVKDRLAKCYGKAKKAVAKKVERLFRPKLRPGFVWRGGTSVYDPSAAAEVEWEREVTAQAEAERAERRALLHEMMGGRRQWIPPRPDWLRRAR
jgi:hypothetical protein